MSTIIKASAPPGELPAAFVFDELGGAASAEPHHAGRDAARFLAGAEHPDTAAPAAAEQVLEEHLEGQFNALRPALRAAVDEIHAAKAQWLAHWEKAALKVATAIAARVVRRQVERTPEVTLALVKEALELAAGRADVQLRMHPDDLAMLGPRVERLAAELGRLGDARIVGDPSITRGGCRVDTRFGTIDQQFESQLARIEDELT